VTPTAEPARGAGRRELGAPSTPRPVEPARTLVERPAAPAVAPPPAGGGDFNTSAARAAMAAAAGAAAGCRQPTDPSGGGRVTVTFSPSGRVASAQLMGGPFQGTRTGACIAASFRSASVPPFAGDSVTVTKDVSLR
jgi:hypothetical protein